MSSNTLLFEHVPKSGGSTLEGLLKKKFTPEYIYGCATDSHNQILAFKNLTVSEQNGFDFIYGHGVSQLAPLINNKCIKITIIRDPIDRFISNYYHIIRSRSHSDCGWVNRLSLRKFVEDERSQKFALKLVPRFSGYTLAETLPAPDEALKKAVKQLDDYLLVGITERFDETVLILWKLMGWDGFPLYQKKNIGRNRALTQEIGSDTLFLIGERCDLDARFYSIFLERFEQESSLKLGRLEKERFVALNAFYSMAVQSMRFFKLS